MRGGVVHAWGYTNGSTIALEIGLITWQHLAVYKQNTAEHGLLGRTILLRKTPRSPSVLLAF